MLSRLYIEGLLVDEEAADQVWELWSAGLISDEETASVGRKRIQTSPASPFYGYPAEVIAEWCGVSIGTAKHYKAGRRKPPTPVLRLFRLYRDGKVLGKRWDQYKVVDEKLFGPDGRFVIEAHISHLAMVCQMLAEKDPDGYAALIKKSKSA